MTLTTIIFFYFYLIFNILTRCQQVQYNLSASQVFVQSTPFNMTLGIYPTKGYLIMNITGPANKWFGVGFGSTSMANTYAIICSKNDTISICQENKLGNDYYGTQLTKTMSTINDNIIGNVRKVFIKRNITINNSNYYSFPTWTKTISVIYAVGTTQDFTQNSQMSSSFGAKTLSITNGLSNNLTVNSMQLGTNITLNGILVYPDENIIQINITGPANVYFGIGFNNTFMGSPSSPTYAIVCDTYGCDENQLTGHSFGTLLSPLTTIIAVNDINNNRNLVINRKRNITASDTNSFAKYFEFPANETTIPVIYAIGQSSVWDQSNPMSFSPGTYGTTNIKFSNHHHVSNFLYANQLLFESTHDTVAIRVYPSPSNATVSITLTGPSDLWFGIGFNSTRMQNTYAIVCSNEMYCFEQFLGDGTTGQRFPTQHIITKNDSVSNGIRTVQLTRKQIITQNDDVNYEYFFDFPSNATKIPIIYAYGTNDIFITNESLMAAASIGVLTFRNDPFEYNLTATKALFSSVGEYIKIQVLPDLNKVFFTFSGPTNAWYGIGFNSTRMQNTYAIIVSQDETIVQEQILGNGSPGYKLENQNILIDSVSVNGNMRTVKLSRPISIYDDKVYDFPVDPKSINIIYAYGSNNQFNNSFMANASIGVMIFNETNSNSSNSTSFCTSGVEYYGTSAYVDNGLSVGLWIYCDTETIRMSINYTNYQPNWFGIVFNTVMAPSPNATVFTVGKQSEEPRALGLYAYDLGAENINEVIYHPERNWKKISEIINGRNVSLVYEKDLSDTKWSTSTRSITFRYAWGTAQQGLVLQQHPASQTSSVYTFNLIQPKSNCLWNVGQNVLNLTAFNDKTISMFDPKNNVTLYAISPCGDYLLCNDTKVMSGIYYKTIDNCNEYLSIWNIENVINPNYNSKLKAWQFVYDNGEKCNGFDPIFEVYWYCDLEIENDAKIVNFVNVGECTYQMMINSSYACS